MLEQIQTSIKELERAKESLDLYSGTCVENRLMMIERLLFAMVEDRVRELKYNETCILMSMDAGRMMQQVAESPKLDEGVVIDGRS